MTCILLDKIRRMDKRSDMNIEVVLALPQTQYLIQLHLAPGHTARMAVDIALAAGLVPAGTSLDVDPASAALGVFGERVQDDYLLRPGDRVEIYRPLQQDPKDLRRQRARQSPV